MVLNRPFLRVVVPTLTAVAAVAGLGAADASAAASSQAKPKHRVNIEKVHTVRTVKGALEVSARPAGKPSKVSFFVDGTKRDVVQSAPYRLGGTAGSLDTSKMSAGKHRVTVKVQYPSGRVRVATIRMEVDRVPVGAAAGSTAPTSYQTVTTTTLPTTQSASAPTAAPSSGPTAVTASTPAPRTGTPAWDGTADRGLSVWSMIQDGLHNSSVGDTSISIVDSPFEPGHKAFRFVVSSLSASGGPRAELADGFHLTEGMEWWFGDVLYLPSSPNKAVGWADSNHTVVQWKNDGSGSPPLALDIRDWGNSSSGLGIDGTTGWKPLLTFDQLYDKPVSIQTRVRFSSDPNKGEVEVWANGQRIFGPVKTQTLYPGTFSYFKQGQYGQGRGNVVYWRGAMRGPTRESVGG